MELEFPEEAIILFGMLDAAVMAEPALVRLLQEAKTDYMNAGEEHLLLLQRLASALDIDPLTANMILLLQLALELRPVYREKGYSDTLYLASMQDLRYKMMETKQLHHVWGNFALKWYRPFFQCTRFALGRLQYELRPWSGPDFVPWLRTGETCYFCHIPSSGSCPPEAVLESLKQAYGFFHIEGVFALGCYSWLLYPPHVPLFPENGNMVKFQKNFTILDREERDNLDLWRIFGVDKNCDYALLPEDTTLRRNFAHWLRQGNQMGCSHGVLLFDGENILPPQAG